MQKTLILLRHGKAETAEGTQEDADRQLTDRGVKESALIGEYMARRGIQPQKILCSTATRTRETCEAMQKAHGHLSQAEFEESLYMASDNQLLQRIAGEDDNEHSLMIIGHNPGLHQLALRLSGAGEKTHLRQLAMSFPTCSLAVMSFEAKSWGDISAEHGKLEVFISPSDIYS